MSDHIKGKAGSAVRLRRDDRPAMLSAWLIHAPGQSPAWGYYVLFIIHLKHLENVPEAIHRPKRDVDGRIRLDITDGGYEIVLSALAGDRTPDPADFASFIPLTPFNHTEQLCGLTDSEAARLCDALCREIVAGRVWAEPALSTGGGIDALISEVTAMLRKRMFLVQGCGPFS